MSGTAWNARTPAHDATGAHAAAFDTPVSGAPARPPVRMLRHPGPMPAMRWTSVENPAAPALRLELPAGATLYDALVQPLRERGLDACAINLLDGHFTRGAYCLARPMPDIGQVIAYTAPIMVGRDLRMIGAGATLGEDEHGAPLLHCHGLLVDAEGCLIGGHLLTEQCVIGPGGCVAYVHVLRATRLTRRYDPHIQLAVFQPEARGDIHADHYAWPDRAHRLCAPAAE